MKERLIDLYLKHEIFKISFDAPYTWSSGLKSPFYCDHRKILSHCELRDLCVKALVELIKNEFPDTRQIAAVATAGIPWGSMLADRMQLPLCYVRSKPKEHGLGKMIEGQFQENLPTVVIEDLFSTGKSATQAAQSIKQEFANAKIIGLAALFSYELNDAFKGVEEMKQIAKSVLVLNNILKYVKISEEQMQPYRILFSK
jgi:orotate phosphoribosyltransferase